MEDVKNSESPQAEAGWLGRFLRKIWYRKDLMIFWGIVATFYVLLIILLVEKYVLRNI